MVLVRALGKRPGFTIVRQSNLTNENTLRCSDQNICVVDCFLLVLGYGWAQGTIPTPLVLECMLVESPNFQLNTKSESLFQLNNSTKKSKAIFSIKQEKLKTKIWDI